jgi:AraC-like DNA-binding protein
VTSRSFTSKDAALTINYIGFVFRTLINEGYSATSLLKNTELNEESFVDPDFRCTFAQHRTFVKNAIDHTGDPHLGPRMGSRFNPINIGLPISAAASSDVLSTALTTLKQFISLNFSIVNFDFYEQDKQLILRWRSSIDVSDIEYFVMGSCLSVTENLLALLLDERNLIEHAELAFDTPENWSSFASTLNFPVRFNAPFNQLVLSNRYLSKPLIGTDPIVHQNMVRLCEKQMAMTFYTRGIEAQVSRLIAQRHYHVTPISDAAQTLGLSERSLRRQLNQSGTSYKKIEDQVRSARAKELLAVIGLPVSTVAYDLGFSDPSNFARTFKRWSGQSPQDYRETISKGRQESNN